VPASTDRDIRRRFVTSSGFCHTSPRPGRTSAPRSDARRSPSAGSGAASWRPERRLRAEDHMRTS